MSVKYATVGSQVHVYDLDEDTFSDKLRPRVYTLEYSDCSGFHLKILKSKFEVPKRIYGSTLKRAKKVVNTYNDRDISTGVALTGKKGAGKTLQSEVIANEMIDNGIAVIIIDKNFGGKSFSNFLNLVGEAVLFFDEVGKNFATKQDRNDRDHNSEQNSQDELLTMMDGVFSFKRLFLFTENEKSNINEYMIDRPSRLYYHYKYGKLEEAVIYEYCDDKGIDKSVQNEIVEASRIIKEFSFDILQSIVEEYLRYHEPINETIQDLNITFENKKYILEVQSLVDMKTQKPLKFLTKEISDYEGEDSYDFKCEYIMPEGNRDEFDEILEGIEGVSSSSDEEKHNNAWFTISSDIKYNSIEKMVYENPHYRLVGKLVEKIPTYYKAF